MREPAGETRRAHAFGIVALAYVFAAIAVRAVTILRWSYNSDEPQHLHVAWQWSRGLVAYRDVYDNHLPLFHLLIAPWIAVVGETPHILFYARLLMVPLVLAILVLTWKLAAELYDPTLAWWATFAAAVSPPMLRPTIEFRNDVLWLLLLLAALLLFFRERRFIAGIVLGAALMVSIKTAPFAMALALAVIVTRYGSLVRVIAGSVIVPAVVTAFLAFHGAADDMFRWSVFANGAMPVEPSRRMLGAIWCIVLSAVAIWFGRRWSGDKRAVAAAIAVFHVALFVVMSPLIGPRDFLPVYPIGFMLLFASLAPRRRHLVACLLVPIALGEARLWQTPSRYYPQIVADALRFTAPADPVFDRKGEMVFRRRATYLALESVSQRRLAAGELQDTIAADIVAARAYAALRDSARIPPESRAFLNRYFVPVSAIRVAGQHIRGDGTFEIAIPGSYTIVRGGRIVVPARWYAAGTYRGPAGATALWSDVVQRAGDLRALLMPLDKDESVLDITGK